MTASKRTASAAEHIDAGQKRAAAAAQPQRELTAVEAAYLSALQAERQNYVTRGASDRVAAIDTEIARITGA